MTHVVIDPVTRVGGGLRVELEVDRGAVSEAWVSGMTYRGIERILEGRDARDAALIASRVCGSCSGIHALAAVRAVERAVGTITPMNGRLVRNLLTGTQLLLDHVSHFYARQAFDWVDIAAALTADEQKTANLAMSLADWPNSTASHFADAKVKLQAIVGSNASGLGANAPWGHPAYTITPEAGLMIASHGLEALDWARELARVRVMLGGKDPHPQTFVIGGLALAVPWGGPPPGPPSHPDAVDKNAPMALSTVGLARMADILSHAAVFVEQAFVPDTIAIARSYPDWTEFGTAGATFLAGGEFPEDDAEEPRLFLPRGVVAGDALNHVDPIVLDGISEATTHSWYDDPEASRQPKAGRTEPKYAGPRLPLATLSGSVRYSWSKAPRYDGEPAETGALARMFVALVEGRKDVIDPIDRVVAQLGVAPDALLGTWGRTVARAAEASALTVRLQGWLDELRQNIQGGDLAIANLAKWDTASWPATTAGWSLGESAGGAVGHWVSIRGGRIERYQIVDGTTWNASPRGADGRRGPMEQALIGTPVADTSRPIEVLRTIHSFDPCPTCGVH